MPYREPGEGPEPPRRSLPEVAHDRSCTCETCDPVYPVPDHLVFALVGLVLFAVVMMAIGLSEAKRQQECEASGREWKCARPGKNCEKSCHGRTLDSPERVRELEYKLATPPVPDKQ